MIYQNLYKVVTGAARMVAALVIAMLASCNSVIYDDLEPCPMGVSLRFVYDYNMEYANAFPKKVDCITLYVYDEEGNYLSTHTESSELLRSEEYRMTVDLEGGKYRLVAYGGMACPQRSFSMVDEPAAGMRYEDRRVEMAYRTEADGSNVSSARLHDHYFGTLDIEVAGEDYTQGTVYMMKNTNNIRIVLQQLSGEPVNAEDFTVRITDDNTLFNSDNTLLPNGGITYAPWAAGQAVAGQHSETDEEVVVFYSELSTSRLMTRQQPRLVIKRNDRGTDVVNIPLIDYLLLLKSDLYADMPAQEFLDRESEWSLVFFLDTKYDWIRTHIVINDWVVRINNTEL